MSSSLLTDDDPVVIREVVRRLLSVVVAVELMCTVDAELTRHPFVSVQRAERRRRRRWLLPAFPRSRRRRVRCRTDVEAESTTAR